MEQRPTSRAGFALDITLELMVGVVLNRRLMALGAACATFIAVSVGVVAVGMLFETCSNREVSRVGDPSGRYTAVVFERKCDLTEAWVTHVRVVPMNEVLTHEVAGNAFVGSERLSPSSGSGVPDARIYWDGVQLVVRYFADERAQVASNLPAGFAVTYHPSNEL